MKRVKEGSMEDEKIIDLKNEDLPIDRDSLCRKLQDIPEEIKTSYVKGISFLIDELLIWKNILTGNSSAANHILEGLDHSYLERFNTIVSNLIFADSKKSISNILEATMDMEMP